MFAGTAQSRKQLLGARATPKWRSLYPYLLIAREAAGTSLFPKQETRRYLWITSRRPLGSANHCRRLAKSLLRLTQHLDTLFSPIRPSFDNGRSMTCCSCPPRRIYIGGVTPLPTVTRPAWLPGSVLMKTLDPRATADRSVTSKRVIGAADGTVIRKLLLPPS
jgi:hypothetical protein